MIRESISGILDSLDKLFTSDEERIRAEALKIKEEIKPYIKDLENTAKQIEVNIVEAKHPSIFVSGARPAILWVFAIALLYQFLLHPLLEWVWVLSSAEGSMPPSLQMQEMWPLISGMLGLAGWRTIDKVKGVARENMKKTL